MAPLVIEISARDVVGMFLFLFWFAFAWPIVVISIWGIAKKGATPAQKRELLEPQNKSNSQQRGEEGQK